MGSIIQNGIQYAGSPSELSQLNDVSIINIQDGQMLSYDSTNSVWVNIIPNFADVNSFGSVENTSTAAEAHNKGDIFTFNGSLVKATDDIDINDTIDNTNTDDTTLNDELNKKLTYEAQTLTDSQKTQVRTNIAAASAASVTKINDDIYSHPANKNGIFTGRNLGTLTASNIDAFLSDHKVSTGEFEGLGLGDYFVIQDGYHNSTWMIAGFDHFYNKGSVNTYFHHLTLIPKEYLNKPQVSTDDLCPMNSTDTTGVSKNSSNPLYATTQGNETAGYQAYYGCDMNQIYLPTIATALQQALGTHLKKIDYLLDDTMNMTGTSSNAWVGFPTNWHWIGANNQNCGYAIIPTEEEIYGCGIFGTNKFCVGINNQKLPVFNFIAWNYFSRTLFWLRSVASSAYFCNAGGNYGVSRYYGASYRLYVRPLINIG